MFSAMTCLLLIVSMVGMKCEGIEATQQIATRVESLMRFQGSSRQADMIYGSKRRVPIGSDPIHNRCVLVSALEA